MIQKQKEVEFFGERIEVSENFGLFACYNSSRLHKTQV